MKQTNPGFHPDYDYPYWVNSVPARLKYFQDTMEHMYKRKTENDRDKELSQFIQGRITEER